LAWLSVWSKVQTCIWPSWCHCHSLSLASVKSRLVLPFWYRLTRVVLDKGPLNGCVCVCTWECTVAPTGDYSWTIVQWQHGLLHFTLDLDTHLLLCTFAWFTASVSFYSPSFALLRFSACRWRCHSLCQYCCSFSFGRRHCAHVKVD